MTQGDNKRYIIAGVAALALAGYVLWRNWPSDSSDSKDDGNKEDEIVETVQQEPFEEKTTIKMVSQEAAVAAPAETTKVENVKKEEIAEKV